jgi:hypothetical protein
VKAGVVDPTKVTRYALQNAASISGLLLTTEALVTERYGSSRSQQECAKAPMWDYPRVALYFMGVPMIVGPLMQKDDIPPMYSKK